MIPILFISQIAIPLKSQTDRGGFRDLIIHIDSFTVTYSGDNLAGEEEGGPNTYIKFTINSKNSKQTPIKRINPGDPAFECNYIIFKYISWEAYVDIEIIDDDEPHLDTTLWHYNVMANFWDRYDVGWTVTQDGTLGEHPFLSRMLVEGTNNVELQFSITVRDACYGHQSINAKGVTTRTMARNTDGSTSVTVEGQTLENYDAVIIRENFDHLPSGSNVYNFNPEPFYQAPGIVEWIFPQSDFTVSYDVASQGVFGNSMFTGMAEYWTGQNTQTIYTIGETTSVFRPDLTGRARDCFYMYPDHPIDSQAANMLLNAWPSKFNTEIGSLDTPGWIDPVTGRPLVESDIITVGGPLANKLISHYEIEGICPVSYQNDEDNHYFVKGDIILGSFSRSSINSGSDVFLVQRFTDPYGHGVVSMYGIAAQGTLAASTFFADDPRDMLTSPYTWMIYEWHDTGDSIPQPSECTLHSHGA